MIPPSIEESTEEERIMFLKTRFKCIANCDACGNCIYLHHSSPELIFNDYIKGRRSFNEISIELRNSDNFQ